MYHSFLIHSSADGHLGFWMLRFKPTFSLSSLTFIKRLFSSSSFSAIRVVSSAYLRLLIYLLTIVLANCIWWMSLSPGTYKGGSIKICLSIQETQVWSLEWEYHLEMEMATHFSILAWEMPCTEEHGRLQFMGLQQNCPQKSTHTLRCVPCYKIKSLDFCRSGHLLLLVPQM